MAKQNEDIRNDRREYYRQWRAKNPERVAIIQERFWKRKVEQMRKETGLAVAALDPKQQETGCGK